MSAKKLSAVTIAVKSSVNKITFSCTEIELFAVELVARAFQGDQKYIFALSSYRCCFRYEESLRTQPIARSDSRTSDLFDERGDELEVDRLVHIRNDNLTLLKTTNEGILFRFELVWNRA